MCNTVISLRLLAVAAALACFSIAGGTTVAQTRVGGAVAVKNDARGKTLHKSLYLAHIPASHFNSPRRRLRICDDRGEAPIFRRPTIMAYPSGVIGPDHSIGFGWRGYIGRGYGATPMRGRIAGFRR